jgi:hypothetical protein
MYGLLLFRRAFLRQKEYTKAISIFARIVTPASHSRLIIHKENYPSPTKSGHNSAFSSALDLIRHPLHFTPPRARNLQRRLDASTHAGLRKLIDT